MALVLRGVKGSPLTIEERDNNMLYLEKIGLTGKNYIFISANKTPVQNAAELEEAYNSKDLSPSVDNRITIILANGLYNFSTAFVLNRDYIDLVSLDGNRSVIFNGEGTISVESRNVFIKGIDVLDKEFKLSSDLNSIVIENCKGGDYSFGGLGDASGYFKNCQGGDYSFGGLGDASGYFKNCQGGIFSFGGGGVSSGIFEDCIGNMYSFGGQGTANGTYTRCVAQFGSFGGDEFLGNMSFCELKSGIYPPIIFLENVVVGGPLSCPAELPEGVTEEQFLRAVVGVEEYPYYQLFDRDFEDGSQSELGPVYQNPVSNLIDSLKVFYFADPACLYSGSNITPKASIKASIDGLGLFYPQIGRVQNFLGTNLETGTNLENIGPYKIFIEQALLQLRPIIGQLSIDLESHIGEALPIIQQSFQQIGNLFRETFGETPLSSSLPEGMTETDVIEEFGFTEIWPLILLLDEQSESVETPSTILIQFFSAIIIIKDELTAFENDYLNILNNLESQLTTQFFIDFETLISVLSGLFTPPNYARGIEEILSYFQEIQASIDETKAEYLSLFDQILTQLKAIFENENIPTSITLPPGMTGQQVLTTFNLFDNWEIIKYFGGQNNTNELLTYLNGIIIFANNNQLNIEQLIIDLSIDQILSDLGKPIQRITSFYSQNFNQIKFTFVSINEPLTESLNNLVRNLEELIEDGVPLISSVTSQLLSAVGQQPEQ